MIRAADALVVAEGDDARHLALAVQYARAAAVREGRPAPWLARLAADTLPATQRHTADAQTPALPRSEVRITSDEAAHIMGCSRRRVQALADELQAVRRGRRWWFDRNTVTAYQALREEHRGRQSA